MRIAHATDIHWFVPPQPSDLRSFKRTLGAANLYLGGRRHHYPDHVPGEVVSFIHSLAPDLFCLTGDLTATALHCLGIAPDSEVHDTLKRPIPASRGTVIRGIL